MAEEGSPTLTQRATNPQQPSDVPFTLAAGDTITDCSLLPVVCDRVAEELGKCHACGQKTFRVVTIRSAANLERRSALCEQHFVLAARRLPELWGGKATQSGS